MFFLLNSLYLFLLIWTWSEWPLTWLTDHCHSVVWHCWLGHLTCKIVARMTYNVFSGILGSDCPLCWHDCRSDWRHATKSSDDECAVGTYTPRSTDAYPAFGRASPTDSGVNSSLSLSCPFACSTVTVLAGHRGACIYSARAMFKDFLDDHHLTESQQLCMCGSYLGFFFRSVLHWAMDVI